MKNLKVIFMGTPLFSVPILEELINKTNVIMVVTSPDAFVGRRKTLTACPVKETALKYNIPVFSPENIKKDYQRIIDIKPDIIITCAYGQIIPKILLDLPSLGCINIHASLLPKYRGGAPIHWAIMNGEAKTGITIMYMDEKMDSGDMIDAVSIKIKSDDNLETLSNKLSLLGRDMIINVLPSIINKTNKRIKQDITKVTYAPIITREDELLNFNKTAFEVYNQIKALSPEPLAYFKILSTEFKVVECEIVEVIGQTNTVVAVDKKSFTIMCVDKGIKITKIKPKGKNIMNVQDFFNGFNRDLLLSEEVL